MKSLKGQKGTSDSKKGKFRLRGTGGRLVLSCRNGKNYSKSERKKDAADQRRKGSGAQMKAVIWRKVG